MGRDISFVAVPKNPPHEPLKLCHNLNYELDGDNADCFMYVHFPESQCIYSVKSENCEKLCSVCAWFMAPMIDKKTEPMILDELSFTYYYTSGSPIHSSNSIFHLLPVYEADDSYIQSTHSRVYKVTQDGINTLESNINRIVNPISKNSDSSDDDDNWDGDTEAFYDSKSVLSFLKSWCDKDDVKLLCFR
jgi:hypothetical protein